MGSFISFMFSDTYCLYSKRKTDWYKCLGEGVKQRELVDAADSNLIKRNWPLSRKSEDKGSL